MKLHSPSSFAFRRSDAFTLIELLTVIAIIGILSALSFLGINASRQQATLARCASNLRQIGIASLNYAGDNKDQLPPFPTNPSWWDGYSLWNNPSGNSQWIGLGKLYEGGYTTDGRIFYCPTALKGTFDYESQWLPNVRGTNNVTGFRAGYSQRIAPTDRKLTLTDGVNHILMTDIFVANYSQHASARNGWQNSEGHPSRYVNIVYMDGHVRCDKSGNRWAKTPDNALYENWEKNP